jgi:small GTP-binding protein
MIQKKICMLGTFSVGKTSLVRRFVESVYFDKYHTTMGVKVDKKVVQVGDQEVALMLWDIEGTEHEYELRQSYVRGAAGYLLVADGTRPDTLEKAISLQARAEATVGKVPFLLLINKSDLAESWLVRGVDITELEDRGWTVIMTSAKTGEGVEDAFQVLAKKMMGDTV